MKNSLKRMGKKLKEKLNSQKPTLSPFLNSKLNVQSSETTSIVQKPVYTGSIKPYNIRPHDIRSK